MSWKEKASIEKEKLKQMSARDKIWYIWEYYKFHLAALAVVICLISVIGNALYRQSFTTRLSIAVINDRSGDTGSMDPLEADLRRVLDCGKKDIIEINTGLMATYGDNVTEFGYATMAKISALVASRGLDVVIADRDSIDHYAGVDAFADLSELLPADLYDALAGEVYSAAGSEGQMIPAAVSLEGTRFYEITGIVMDPPYLAVIDGSPRKEAAVQMIRYLFP